MQQKVILITGAAGSLGEAVVEKFLKENYIVVGTVNKIDNSKNDIERIKVDLTDEAASNQIVQSIIKKHNKIDVAVLTVGGFKMNKIADTKTSDIYKQYQINFETAYNIARPVFIHMMEQNNGRIFLIGSKPGLDAKNSKGMIAYGLSKSLLFRLAELMNDEAKNKKVVVHVVVPSTIDTEANRKAMPGADFSQWVKPETIADLIFHHQNNNEVSEMPETIIKAYN